MEPFKSNIFTQGAISPAQISERIAIHTAQTVVGGYNIFLGQVRADAVGDQRVQAIEYTAYEEMAVAQFEQIFADLFEKYDICHLEVLQSLGQVAVGEICLLVLATAPHRKAATSACLEMVERLKKELPIWGKEIFETEGYQWKVNT